MFKVGDYVIPKEHKVIKVVCEIEEIENEGNCEKVVKSSRGVKCIS